MHMSPPCLRGRTPGKPAAGEYVPKSFLAFVKSSDSFATNCRGGGSLAEWLERWTFNSEAPSSSAALTFLLCLILFICLSHLLGLNSISAINTAEGKYRNYYYYYYYYYYFYRNISEKTCPTYLSVMARAVWIC